MFDKKENRPKKRKRIGNKHKGTETLTLVAPNQPKEMWLMARIKAVYSLFDGKRTVCVVHTTSENRDNDEQVS